MGVGAAAFNQIHLPLLTEETPRFLLGGSLVLLVFACFGERAGIVAAALSVAGSAFGEGASLSLLPAPHQLVLGVYLLEAWVAYHVFRRTSSFILGVACFWFLGGWVLDLALYGGWLGLSQEYLALLMVKQLFNALINASVAEALLRLRTVRRLLAGPAGAEEATGLQAYAFQRVILAVMIPSIVLGLAYTRSEFWNEIAAVQARSNRTAEAVSDGVRQYLGAVGGGLERVARRLDEPRDVPAGRLSAMLAELRAGYPELVKTAVFDAGGNVLAADPAFDAAGRSIAGLNVAGQEWFVRLHDTGDTVFTPLFDPTLRVAGEDVPEHVLLVVEPLVDQAGAFTGGLVVALDPRGLVPVLRARRSDAAERVTIFDRRGRVIVSLDPGRPIGAALPTSMFDHYGRPLGEQAWRLLEQSPADFSYYPPNDGSVVGGLGLNPNYATSRRVVLADWRVLVDLPASELQRMIVPTAYAVVTLVLLTIVVLYLTVVLLTRRIAEPITTVSRLAADIVGGGVGSGSEVDALASSPVEEFRQLAGHMLAMQEAIVAHRARSAAREQESHELFEATFEQAAVGIAHTSLDGRILRINDEFCRLLGRDRSELVGAEVDGVVAGGEAWLCALTDQLVRGDRPVCTTERRFQSPGRSVWARFTVSLIRAASGQPRFCMLVAEDVTDRKALEEQFLQSQKMESIGRLAGGIAHDFNNLLTPMLGYAEMVLADTPEGSPQRDALEQVHLAARRAKGLTWQLLAFSRKQVLEFETVDLADVVAQFEDMIRLGLRENVELQVDVDPDLGLVRADPAQIQQVLMNLAVNAQDAMPHGGRLRIRAANVQVTPEFAAQHGDVPEGPAVVLSVSDTGGGIAPEIMPNIFEPFFTTKERGRGTGLGLATVYGIARQHRAGVVVVSRPGKGSTFAVYFPRVASPAGVADGSAAAVPAREGEEERAAAATTPGGNEPPAGARSRAGERGAGCRPAGSGAAGSAAGGGATVLLVEDDEAVRRVVCRALQREGFTVLEAGDAEAASRIARAHPEVDVLLTDVILPGVDGRELAESIGRPGLRTVYMSGYTREVLSKDGVLPPGTHLLSKPFSMQALTDKLREVLEADAAEYA